MVNKSLPTATVGFFCLIFNLKIYIMAIKVYQKNNFIVIEEATEETIYFIPGKTRLYSRDSGTVFTLYDSLTDTNKLLGGFANIQDQAGVSFSNGDDFIQYISILINFLPRPSTILVDVNVATYSLLSGEDILHVTYTATGAVTITLPINQTFTGRRVEIKDAGGNSTANNITINTEGGAKIDGADTALIDIDYNNLSLYCDGTNWFIY